MGADLVRHNGTTNLDAGDRSCRGRSAPGRTAKNLTGGE